MISTCRKQSAGSDVDLIQLIWNKDDHAFDLLYKKYWQPLLRFASHYLDDEDTCAEIVQDLFVHLHCRSSALRVRSSISSYLHTALRNRIINHIRNQAVYKKHVLRSFKGSALTLNDVEQFINLVELKKEISYALKKMPAKYSEVYLLQNQHHFNTKKIAIHLNRSVDTVEKQLHKATALLRNHLKESKLKN
jgi:RNA polymerase sigma-70 factor (ECF subfamily)